MSEKLGITDKYRMEIQKIGNKLRELENEQVYNLSGNQSHGYLATNASQLREMFEELINKIDNQAPSIGDKFNEYFRNKGE
ncbi:hypothetical protein [Priestia megaterium]|uniref:hypothetical protein n=1 Tax=Priestia megaterium TaxID=1404 RepID=UPI00207AD995|nr:hypothetical protein [Priestia megaterium]USL32924.1 hypothetical protein LIT30_12245 [Priestia megaterium]